MKELLVLLFTMAIVANVSAQNKKDSEPFTTKNFPDANINKVHVKTFAGSISVLGKDGSQPRIEMYVNENNQRGTAPSAIEK